MIRRNEKTREQKVGKISKRQVEKKARWQEKKIKERRNVCGYRRQERSEQRTRLERRMSTKKDSESWREERKD